MAAPQQLKTSDSRPAIVLAYLHEGINIPEFALSVATTLGGDKTRKDLKMFLSAHGIDVTDGKTTWTVPMQNVKCFKLA